MSRWQMAIISVTLFGVLGCSRDDKAALTKNDTTKLSTTPPISNATKANDLKEIAVMYLTYLDKNPNKSPFKVDDFAALASDYPQGMAGLKQGRYVVRWNAKMPTDAQKIVAYESDVPSKGGLVVSLMGETRTVTADEFKTAAKAGTGN
jgi:hypothetical protein